VVSDTRQFVWWPDKRRFMGELARLAGEQGLNCSDIRGLLRTHLREFMGERFFRDVIAPNDWTAFCISKYYWREKQYQALPWFDPNTVLFRIFDPPASTGIKFRDIGRSEPSVPNLYPFLDGKPIPTAEELRRAA